MMPSHLDKDKYCEHCGAELVTWKDIAAAMREMLSAAPPGVKPMFQQADQEIEQLRAYIFKMDYVCPWLFDAPYRVLTATEGAQVKRMRQSLPIPPP